jgi:hypothetical protein
MGEYINWQGDSFKIGTCEDLYYVTFDDLLNMIKAGATKASGTPRDYVRDGGFRFRFPFPDEDQEDIGRKGDKSFDRGLVVVSPPEIVGEMEHSDLWVHLPIKGGDFGYQVNAKVHCPQAKDADSGQFSQGGTTYNIIQIVQQKAVDNNLWVVVRCPYCGTMIRLEPEWGRKLADYICKHYSDDFHKEVALRIYEGYNRDVKAALG